MLSVLSWLQLAGLVEGVGLEEAPDRRTRFEELPVARALLLIGGEHGALGRRLPGLDDLHGPLLERRARLIRRHAFDNEETVPPEALDIRGAQHDVQCRWPE